MALGIVHYYANLPGEVKPDFRPCQHSPLGHESDGHRVGSSRQTKVTLRFRLTSRFPSDFNQRWVVAADGGEGRALVASTSSKFLRASA